MPCHVEIIMTPTIKNKEIINIYDKVDLFYDTREKDSVVGSLSDETFTLIPASTSNKKKSEFKKLAKLRKKSDIRSFIPAESIWSAERNTRILKLQKP